MIDMENLVRERMDEQTDGMDLEKDAATKAIRAAARRRRSKRLALMAGSSAAFAVAGTGIAAAAGVLPWWTSVEATTSSPFATAQDPAAVAGSQSRLTIPGPESTTFEVVTNTMTTGAQHLNCTAVAVKDAHGRSQHLTNSCGAPGAFTALAGSFDWQAPSGATYAIVTGPAPTSDAAKVVLTDSNGVTSSEPVAGGFYLVYAPAASLSPNDRLVFYDTAGKFVDEMSLGFGTPKAATGTPTSS